MFFISTRGSERVTGAQAVVRGMPADGGLFVPESFPAVSAAELGEMLGMDYPERVAFILKKYFDEYDGEELLNELRAAYARFEEGDPAPLVRIENGTYILELFHGPTCAYQDMALAAFPYLLRKGCEIENIKDQILLLVATSGDIGKAALETFGGVEGVRVLAFYPEEGVSKMQKHQLCTTEWENESVVAVRGNFDDCQTGVKRILSSEECVKAIREKGYLPTTANAVNFGRLASQIAHYFSAYCDLVSSDQIACGDKVDFAVPAGNFGNLLAAYYAKRMGLPVGKLICGTNRNNALNDFFKVGTYDVKRSFYRTMSPSMDILVASDLERLVFDLSGKNVQLTAKRMQSLAEKGKYSLTQQEFAVLREQFYAGYTSEDDTVECIYEFFTEYGYPMDTHTGVAMNAAQNYLKSLEDQIGVEEHPMVVVSTASPYKCPQDVLYALTGNDVKDSFKGVKRINLLTAMKVPESLKAIRYKPVRFKQVVTPAKMSEEVLKFISE